MKVNNKLKDAISMLASRRAKKKMNKDVIDETSKDDGYVYPIQKEDKKEKINYKNFVKLGDKMAAEMRKNKKK